MKIGCVTGSISRQAGGLMDSARREAAALADRGHAVEVFATDDSDSALDLLQWTPLQVRLFQRAGPARFSYGRGLSQALLDADLDVLLSHGLWRYTSIAAFQWSKELGRPYMVSPHGMLQPWALQNSRLRKKLAALFFEDRHLKHAACIRALCEAEADAIRNYGMKNPIAVIPNGIDLPELGASIPPAPWSHVPGFSEAKVVLSLGRLHPKKNLMALLNAWKSLRESSASDEGEWRLAIAGWNEANYEKELKQHVKELGLGEHVWFAGPLFGDAKTAAYRNAKAFAIPSRSEGLPMVVLEAWSFALPVLMTPECNLPEGIAAGAALAMNVGTESIAEALRELVSLTPERRSQMGAAGRALCAERFQWSQIATATEEIFLWIRGEAAKPSFVTD
jgi:glycosyltransferase involved in cell wall biosynthesis